MGQNKYERIGYKNENRMGRNDSLKQHGSYWKQDIIDDDLLRGHIGHIQLFIGHHHWDRIWVIFNL